jgi:hypothetical protein
VTRYCGLSSAKMGGSFRYGLLRVPSDNRRGQGEGRYLAYTSSRNSTSGLVGASYPLKIPMGDGHAVTHPQALANRANIIEAR